MIPPQLLVAGFIATASAATGFGAAWQIQSWRADTVALAHAKQEKQRAEITLENERLVAKTLTRNDQNVIAAVNAGAARSIALRRDADAGRDALVMLSDITKAALRDATADHATCLNRAIALEDVFTTMGRAGASVSEKADRHTNDIRTIIEAQPK